MKKLTDHEKNMMTAQLETLSSENLRILASNDLVYDPEKVENNSKNLQSNSNLMEAFQDATELQPGIRLDGANVPDIRSAQEKARDLAKVWRTKYANQIADSLTKDQVFNDTILALPPKDIDIIISEAQNSDAGKETLQSVLNMYTQDAKKYGEDAKNVSSSINSYNTDFIAVVRLFSELYDQIDQIYNSSEGQRALLEKRLEDYKKIVHNYNIGIGFASAAIVASVLISVISAVLSTVSFGASVKIAGAALAVVAGSAGSLPELIKKRDEAQAEVNKLNQELAEITRQCAIALTLKDNLKEAKELGETITPQLSKISENFNFIGTQYIEMSNKVSSGITTNVAAIIKIRLNTAYESATKIKPVLDQVVKNRLLDVQISGDLGSYLGLPSIWTNQILPRSLVFDYLDVRRKKVA